MFAVQCIFMKKYCFSAENSYKNVTKKILHFLPPTMIPLERTSQKSLPLCHWTSQLSLYVGKKQNLLTNFTILFSCYDCINCGRDKFYINFRCNFERILRK